MQTTAEISRRVAISAKRALLREQTLLLGDELPWLSDPSEIPLAAVPIPTRDVPGCCFRLAAWMVGEIVSAARRIQPRLSWNHVFELYEVPPEIQLRIQRAVSEPVTRYAPGLIAMAEIVAAAPVVATRAMVPLDRWRRIARSSEAFSAKLSCDGTEVQVVIRNYLREPPGTTTSEAPRVLNAALLRLDDATGITSVTPIDELVEAARMAVAAHLGPAKGICVAMQVKAPTTADPTATMYGAIWAAYTTAADLLIFQNAERVSAIPSQARSDPNFKIAIDRLARERAVELQQR